ncbi:MAG: AAA-like domain-containing protein [Potamolinea sp.]
MNQQEFTKAFEEMPLQRRKVLQKLLAGETDEAIAKSLQIEQTTVRSHIKKICNDFGIEQPFANERQKRRPELIALFKKYRPDLVSNQVNSATVEAPDEPEKAHIPTELISLPAGIVPLDSPFYVEREADKICRQVLQFRRNSRESLPFIRIKGSSGMGKSSLLVRLQKLLETELNQVVGFVDLASADFDKDAFSNLNKLLYQFTYAIAQTFSESVPNLNPSPLKNNWIEDVASGVNCTTYLHDHIFSKIRQPKTLLIDGIDAVLGQEQTQTPFLQLLRSWNERKMKQVSKAPIVWSSIVIAYSTEPYPDHGQKGSTMQNVGTAIDLQEFTQDQVLALAKSYGLDWDLTEVSSLMQLIGGHPTLINQALYQVKSEKKTLLDLQSQASFLNNPFGDYLLKKLSLLKNNENLLTCFINLLKGDKCHDAFAKFELERSGLIKVENSGVSVRCELYQRYFQEHL